MSNKALIISTCAKHGLLRNQAAYVLATAEWETNHTYLPVEEAYYVKNAEAWRKKNLRYYPWHGRGYVQLTWEENYRKAGEKIGVDLISDPSRAMIPENAAEILVLGMRDGWFTGKKLADYITLKRSDFLNARRIINGTDKAPDIAILARQHDADLKMLGYGTEPVEPQPTAPAKPANWFMALIKFLLSLLPKRKSK